MIIIPHEGCPITTLHMVSMAGNIMRHIGIITIFLLLPLLSGCGFTAWENVPNDLRLSGISLYAGPYARNDQDWKSIDVDLVTDFNYTKYATEERFEMITAYSYFCENEDKKNNQEIDNLILYFYENNTYYPLWPAEKYMIQLIKEHKTYHYHVGIFVEKYRNRFFEHETTIYPHEAVSPPRDVCIKFVASHYYTFIGAVESNVVRIPKEEFIKLFSDEAKNLKER